MDIVKLLQDTVKGFLIFAGLIYAIDVSFDPAVVERRSASECVVTVRLRGAVTPEIEKMIASSTLAVISYQVTLYTERDTKIEMVVVKSVHYKSISGVYSVDSDGRSLAVSSLAEAAEELTGASFVFDPAGITFAVVKAFLDIPDIQDKNAVKSFWGDKAPTLVVDLASAI